MGGSGSRATWRSGAFRVGVVGGAVGRRFGCRRDGAGLRPAGSRRSARARGGAGSLPASTPKLRSRSSRAATARSRAAYSSRGSFVPGSLPNVLPLRCRQYSAAMTRGQYCRGRGRLVWRRHPKTRTRARRVRAGFAGGFRIRSGQSRGGKRHQESLVRSTCLRAATPACACGGRPRALPAPGAKSTHKSGSHWRPPLSLTSQLAVATLTSERGTPRSGGSA